MSYADAVRKLESNTEKDETGQEENARVGGSGTETGQKSICMDKRGFLAFISMVINCALEIPKKSERIKMVLDAAKKFLDVEDITGKEVDDMLREGCAPTQA